MNKIFKVTILLLILLVSLVTVRIERKNKEIRLLKAKIDEQETNFQEKELVTSSALKDLTDKYNEVLEKNSLMHEEITRWSELLVQYPDATIVYRYLTEIAGLNEQVAAGILGNIMVEVGGGTLDISRWRQTMHKYHCGICQWGGGRKTRLFKDFGSGIVDQLQFLCVELQEIFPEGDPFYSMNEKDAAKIFAIKFERCSSKTYNIRMKCASKAYEFFKQGEN